METLDVGDWLRDLAEAPAYGLVKTVLAPGLPPVAGDRTALTSAVTNLLDNAIKYSPPDRPIVLQAEAADGNVTITVSDEGYGIADEDKPHIFEKFYRARGEISQQVKGAGVGLTLIKQIVESHGGSIDFDSQPGVGSTFRIHLQATK